MGSNTSSGAPSQVYRLAEADIGCSLAEAAESDSYMSYLAEAGATPER